MINEATVMIESNRYKWEFEFTSSELAKQAKIKQEIALAEVDKAFRLKQELECKVKMHTSEFHEFDIRTALADSAIDKAKEYEYWYGILSRLSIKLKLTYADWVFFFGS